MAEFTLIWAKFKVECVALECRSADGEGHSQNSSLNELHSFSRSDEQR